MVNNLLKAAHVNARSLVPKLEDIKHFLTEANIDILAVSETWLNSNISNSDIDINGFNLVRRDRDGRGGGVCILVNNSIRYCPVNTSPVIEQVWITIKLQKLTIAVGAIYRPPTINYKLFCDELETTYTLLSSTHDKIICFGDLNIDLLLSSRPDVAYLNSMLNSVGIKQLIAEPTRIIDNKASLLDVILVSDTNSISDSGVLHEYRFSDHETVFCQVQVFNKPNSARFATIRSYKTFNIERFDNDMKLIPWQHIFHIKSVDEKINFINHNILTVLDKHVPLKHVKMTKCHPPWITENMKILISLRNKALAKFKKSKLQTHWVYYKSLRNFTTSAIAKEKRSYFDFTFKQGKSKQLWQQLKSLALTRDKNINLPSHLNNADDINNYFLDSIPDTVSNSNELISYYENNSLANNISELNFTTVDETLIAKLVREIKSNSCGIDGININIIKLCLPHILPYLTHIVNVCIVKNYFPVKWKHGIVIPIPKVTSPVSYKDIRPISILPTFSKILEKIINLQLRNHLHKYSIIPESQSGFRAGYSCSTALLKVTDDLITASDKNHISILTLLDFTKAFDTIHHNVLHAILKFIGLSNSARQLIKSYLEDRLQSVKIDNFISNSRSINKGVPQGSILGPLLFIIYTCRFDAQVQTCKTHMYADDTQLYHSFDAINLEPALIHINRDISNIATISANHSLNINPSKSVVLLFGNKNKICEIKNRVKLYVNNEIIPVKMEAKNLGLLMDNSFKYNNHITNCVKRAYANLKLIYPHRHSLSVKLKTILCDSLILSHFSYCSLIFGPSITQDAAKKVQRVQNSCLRLIFGIRKYDHVSHKLSALNWLNMHYRRQLAIATFYYKVISEKQPSYLYELIPFRTDVHHLNLRNKGHLVPPRHHTALFQKSFQYQIAKFYNNLSDEFKNLSVTCFKNKYRQYLLNIRNVV
jgi:exonuclease III